MTWKNIKIGDIGKIVTGDTPPKKKLEYYGSAYPFIKPSDMRIGERYTVEFEESYSHEGFEKYRKKMIPPGSTAVVTIGSIGQKITLTHTECFVNQAVNAIIPDQTRFYPLYVYYLLKHNLHLVKSADTGASSGRENVSKSNFASLEIYSCLDLEKQTRIAELLDRYDSMLENNKCRIALLEESARLLYREWFVNLRFPGHESVKWIDGLPEGWLTGFATDCINVLSGGTPNTKTDRFWDADIPFFTPKDCNGSMFVSSTEKTLTEEGLQACNSRLFAKETIFITARGTVGKVVMAQKPMAMNQSCYALAPKTGFDNLYLFLAIENGVEHLKAMASGGVFDTIVVDTFRRMPFVCPSVEVTKNFGSVVRPIFNQIENLLIQNEFLMSVRNDLLPKLMSGAIQV